MSTQSDSFGFVRTLIQGDFEANGQYERRLDEQDWAGFPRFLTAVFFLAVDRRFAMPPLVAHKILTDENLTPEELDAFLGRAEQLTSRQA